MSWSGSKAIAFLPVATLALLFDQMTKLYVTRTLDVGSRQPLLGDVLGDFVALTHVPSMGGAFGIFGDWLPAAQLIGFSLLALSTILVIVFFYRGLAPREQGSAAGLALMLGGIASHAFDRLRYGSGLDFLHLGGATSNTIPDFSLADVAIVLGVVTLIIELLATEMAVRASERPTHSRRQSSH